MRAERRAGLGVAVVVLLAAAGVAAGCGQVLGLGSLTSDGGSALQPDAPSRSGSGTGVSRTGTGSGSAAHGDGGASHDSGSGDSAYAEAVLADMPLAYWHLDETTGQVAHEVIDDARHAGRLSATGVTLGVPGVEGTAMKFGATGCIDIMNGADFQFAGQIPFTVELWVSPSTYSAAVTAGDLPFVVGTEIAHGGSYGWSVFLAPLPDGGGFGSLEGWNADAASPIVMSANSRYGCGDGGTGLLPVNGWTYVVSTYDPALQEAEFFVNGASCGKSILMGPLLPAEGSLTMACSNAAAPYGVVSGALDEVAVYAALLPPERILAHYAAH